MQFKSILIAFVAAVATASPLTPRQGDFVAVGNLYSGGGCTASSLIFADPIFGEGNVCQPLDRNGNVPDIISYETLSENAGCTVALYSDLNCATTAYAAPVGQCVQGNAPFVAAFVTCT